MGLLTIFRTAPAIRQAPSVSKADTVKIQASKKKQRKWRKAHKQKLTKFLLENTTEEDLREDRNDSFDLLELLKDKRVRGEEDTMVDTMDGSNNTCSTQMSSSYSSLNAEEDYVYYRRLDDSASSIDVDLLPEEADEADDNLETSSIETIVDDDIGTFDLSMSSILATSGTFTEFMKEHSSKNPTKSRRHHRRLRLSRPANWAHVTPTEFLEWKHEKDNMKTHRAAILGQRNALRTLRRSCQTLEIPFRRNYFSMEDSDYPGDSYNMGLGDLLSNRLMFTAVIEGEENDGNDEEIGSVAKSGTSCNETVNAVKRAPVMMPRRNDKHDNYEHVFISTDTQKLLHMYTIDMTKKNGKKTSRLVASCPPFFTLRPPFSVEC